MTDHQIKEFKDAITPVNLLDMAIAWIRDNLYPEDVFSEKDLESWAREHNGNIESKWLHNHIDVSRED